MARYPVCDECLRVPPLAADYACANCQAPFLTRFPLGEDGLCPLCREGWNGFDRAYAYGAYEGGLEKLIHLLKYQSVETLAKPLGSLLNSALPRAERFDLVVPVPMHWWRRWKRGYNQAGLLARELSKRSGLPVRNLLTRKRWTPPQAERRGASRRNNVRGAFRATSRLSGGPHVLLIDDVLTTGATASACAATLKAAGAGRVTVLTLARVDKRVFPLEAFSPASAKKVSAGGN